MEFLTTQFGTTGLVVVLLSGVAWGASHLAAVKQSANMDFS